MIRERLVDAGRRDPRIAGLVDYGSRGGRALDEWSDVDLGVFLRDAAFDAFLRNSGGWAAQFGTLLLGYSRSSGAHPALRAVYDVSPAAAPLPLRVDMAFRRERDIATAFRWPEVPTVIEAVVLYDDTGGRLTASMAHLTAQPLRPPSPADAFLEVGEEFWYYLLDACAKLRRRDEWGARLLFHVMVVPALLRLLRLEAGAVDRWYGFPVAQAIAGDLPPHRLSQLDRCVPGADWAGLEGALRAAACLGQEVAASLAARYRLPWPEVLAARIVDALSPSPR